MREQIAAQTGVWSAWRALAAAQVALDAGDVLEAGRRLAEVAGAASDAREALVGSRGSEHPL